MQCKSITQRFDEKLETNSIIAENPDQKNHKNMKNPDTQNAKTKQTQITKIKERLTSTTAWKTSALKKIPPTLQEWQPD